MGFWSVVLPSTSAITNIWTNPSMESGAATGYSARSGGTAAVSTTRARHGFRSLSYTPTSNTTDGVIVDAVALTSGMTYTAAFDFWGADTIPFVAFWATTAGTTVEDTPVTWTASAQWTRPVATYAATATANFRLYIAKNTNASEAAFYLDGLTITATSYDPGFIDGGEPDCYWNGAPHLSTSTRKAGSRWGGEETNFDDLAFYLDSWPGAGMAEISALTQPLGILPGSIDAGEKILNRPFTLTGTLIGTSQTNLHYARKRLIDALKSDRVRDDQQFWLTYSGSNASRKTRIRAKYIGGLGMQKQTGFTEKLALKFLAHDPFWYEEGTESAPLLTNQAVTSADYAVKRIDGVWSAVSDVFNGEVYAMTRGLDGSIYFGGNFTAATGSSDGDYIVKYNPQAGTLTALGTGMNGYVSALATAPNGDIYAGGNFTLAGGVANTVRIAKWDGTNWGPLSTGIASGVVYCLEFAPDGYLYVGGSFTNHVDANGDYITRWSGAAFSSMSTGANGDVNAIKYSKADGLIYVGGNFTAIGGVTAGRIASWNGTAFSVVGSGTGVAASGSGQSVNAIVCGENGMVYIAGLFSAVDGVSANNAAVWNGASWKSMGLPADGGGYSGVVALAIDDNGYVYMQKTSASRAYSAGTLYVWNGAILAELPADVPGLVVYAILTYKDDLYIGYGLPGTAYTAYMNTITNSGTASSYPRITFVCDKASSDTATVLWLKNEYTGATLWLDHDLQDGEELEIECATGKRAITSSYLGPVTGQALLKNSNFSEFNLLPGENKISAYVSVDGSPTVTAAMVWPVTYWSNDGSAT